MKIISVVGARPIFMKIAPFIHAIERHNRSDEVNQIAHLLVHTGQHYDDRMSQVFFESLNIPAADIHLGIGSGSHAEQVGHTMIAFEKILLEQKPDWVVVVGDVNATLACSVTAKKLNIPVCHIEAGLRSGDMTMPEEINRLVTDRLSDLLLVPDELSAINLKNEGAEEQKIDFVGNIMIDTLVANKARAESLKISRIVNDNYLSGDQVVDLENYILMTMHRPSNVDDKVILKALMKFIVDKVCINRTLVWPMHPRTLSQLQDFKLWDDLIKTKNIVILKPLNYHEMLKLNIEANCMLTDSGGLQEECSYLGTPCLTLRWNTERPITLRENGGTAVLVGNDVGLISRHYHMLEDQSRIPAAPPLWDGNTAQRMCAKFTSPTGSFAGKCWALNYHIF